MKIRFTRALGAFLFLFGAGPALADDPAFYTLVRAFDSAHEQLKPEQIPSWGDPSFQCHRVDQLSPDNTYPVYVGKVSWTYPAAGPLIPARTVSRITGPHNSPGVVPADDLRTFVESIQQTDQPTEINTYGSSINGSWRKREYRYFRTDGQFLYFKVELRTSSRDPDDEDSVEIAVGYCFQQ